MSKFILIFGLALMSVMYSCSDDDVIDESTVELQNPRPGNGGNNGEGNNNGGTNGGNENVEVNPAVNDLFNGVIDFANLSNYQNQDIPPYIQRDNTRGNPITDAGATLGRVLFYDTQLSVDNSISCASCHQQQFAFGDIAQVSTGVDGVTGRHSMRLVNARFAEETNFFWDERASSLEEQTTMPIQDHIEMGFSGQNGDPSIDNLIDRLSEKAYYNELFGVAYGTGDITEERMQDALAQFIRSIQSFDSKYDIGRGQVNNNNQNFPNFTAQENRGKQLFQRNGNFQGANRVGGGFGCQSCHNAPAFDIDRNSRNNGVINTAADINGRDLTVTRSPSLRDLFDSNGQLNGPMMHTGRFETMEQVLDHYNQIENNGNNNLDRRLRRGNNGQNLNMTTQERDDLIAFLKTLSGSNIYQDQKWSDPFDN